MNFANANFECLIYIHTFAGFSFWTDEAKPKKTVSREEEYQKVLAQIGITDDEAPDDLCGWMDILSDIYNNRTGAWDAKGVTLTDKVTLIKTAMNIKFGKDFEDAEETDHISGVTCMDPKNTIKIGDHSVPDWFEHYNTTGTMPDRVKYYTWWRVDPLHAFSQALVTCSDGNKPALEGFVSGEVQYEVTEANDLVRMLSYCDIYLYNSSRSGAITEPVDILNRSLGFGSLVLAIIELWRATGGLSLLDYNRLTTTWKLNDLQMRNLVSVATMGFVVESPNTTNTAWTDATFKIKSVVKTQLGVTDDKWMEHWYGGVVPWWFVQAVLLKFGGQLTVKTKEPVSVRLNVDEDWLYEVGYHIKADQAYATDISILTSTVMWPAKSDPHLRAVLAGV
uniref:Uncharacterized protein n=1 Tax=Anopheles maculatus TaxID=74869 RepID=A0A182S9K0_9DIPT